MRRRPGFGGFGSRAGTSCGGFPTPTIPRVAVRLICWFPPKSTIVVVALFAADKAHLGDVFYDAVAARADPLIDQWKRETASEEGP